MPGGTNTNTGLDGDAARRANALTAGLPANFFRANPDLLGGANSAATAAYTKYDSMQIELREASPGASSSTRATPTARLGLGSASFRQTATKRLNTGTQGSITHAFKAYGVWELPIGRGRQLHGQRPTRSSNGSSAAGSSPPSAASRAAACSTSATCGSSGCPQTSCRMAFQLRFDDAGKVIYMLPQDIIDNTVRAYNVSATSATGYSTSLGVPTGRYMAPANNGSCIEVVVGNGECGTGALVVTGPRLVRFDISAVKRFDIHGRLNAEFRAEMLNAFNHP